MPQDLLVQQVNKLDSRCDDLDRRMRRFETVALALGMLGLILGVGGGIGAFVLRASNSKLSTFESELAKAQPALDKLSHLQQDIQRLKEEAAPIGKILDNRASSQALLGRIERFKSTSPPK